MLSVALAPRSADCISSDTNNTVSTCPAFYGVRDFPNQGTSWNCPPLPPFLNETVHGEVSTSLPGCNDITSGPAAATLANNTSPAGGNHSSTPMAYVYPPQSPILCINPKSSQQFSNTGWYYNGCFDDTRPNGNDTMNGHSGSTLGLTRSIESCIQYCKSFQFAGLENGNGCICGNSVTNPLHSDQTMCTMHCAGNVTEVCGGPGLISVFGKSKPKSGSVNSIMRVLKKVFQIHAR